MFNRIVTTASTRRTICRGRLERLNTAGLSTAGSGAILRNVGGFREREDRGYGQTGVQYLSMALGVALINCDYSKRSEKGIGTQSVDTLIVCDNYLIDEALFLKAVKSGDLYKVKRYYTSPSIYIYVKEERRGPSLSSLSHIQ